MGQLPQRGGPSLGKLERRMIARKSVRNTNLFFCVLFVGVVSVGPAWRLGGDPTNPCTATGLWAEEVADVFQTAAERRSYRILTGRSEKSRSSLVAKLALSREEVHNDINVLVAATRTLLKERAESINDQRPAIKKAPVPESLVALIQIIAPDPSPLVIPLLEDALVHEDYLVSMAAMDAVGQNQLEDSLETLARQIRRPVFDEKYAYRFALVRAIAKLHSPEAILLLQRLQQQLDGQLRYEIKNRLADADLRDFNGAFDELAEWKEKFSLSEMIDQVSLDIPTPDDGAMSLQAIASSSKGRPKFGRSQYYGIDLNAARILFIIDRSGSMQEPTYHGTRLQRAKQELIRTINGLDASTEFGIMVFDTTIQSFQGELLIASDENKREAAAFVDRVMLGKKTNTYGALVKATDFDDQLEAVFMLTDGRPTFGQIVRPDLIIKDIVRRNRTRHMEFNTIGIGQLGETVVFLLSLIHI